MKHKILCSLITIFALSIATASTKVAAEENQALIEKAPNEKVELSRIYACQIGTQKVFLEKDSKNNERVKALLLKTKVMDALVAEAATKYKISADPEFTAQWSDLIATMNKAFGRDIASDSAPQKMKDILRKKADEMKIRVLAQNVDKFIEEDLKKTDKEYAIYFSEDPAVITANQALISKIADKEGTLGFQFRKMDEWWMRFIEEENCDFKNDDCRRIFEEFKKHGPHGRG